MNDELASLRFNGCLATNIEQAYRRLEQLYECLVEPLGLNVLEWYTLRALYDADGLPASRLAALVSRHPSSMTALLDRMEEKGLLRREVDAHDRRSIRVYLTAKGRALEPRVCIVSEQLAHITANYVTPQQMETFLHVLSILQAVELPPDESPA